jgi:hypothetical protein
MISLPEFPQSLEIVRDNALSAKTLTRQRLGAQAALMPRSEIGRDAGGE